MFRQTPSKRREKIVWYTGGAVVIPAVGWWYGFDPGFLWTTAVLLLAFAAHHWAKLRA